MKERCSDESSASELPTSVQEAKSRTRSHATVCSRRFATIGVLLVITAVLLLTAFNSESTCPELVAPEKPPPWNTASEQSSKTPSTQFSNNGKVHSLQELRSFCHREAPELQKASWMAQHGANVSVEHLFPGVKYQIEVAPVCIDTEGNVRVDHKLYYTGRSLLMGIPKRDYTVVPLRDENFRYHGHAGYALATPALGILVSGLWIATHIWHMLHDCLEGLMIFFQLYNSGEMWRMPTQTVLLHADGNDWVDRYGDTLKKMNLSAQLLNGFSSPLRGGPFFPSSLTIAVGRVPLQVPARVHTNAAIKAKLEKPLMHCFCQAMNVNVIHVGDRIDRRMYYGIQDLATRQFREDDYIRDYSLAKIEQRRLASHPWAKQYWRGDTVDAKGLYRPRALVLHRKSRLIGDIGQYVSMLNMLGFRVEEIYPEDLPLDVQYHLGRYADLLVGMHGLGVGHGFWMNRFPMGCRTIVEFRPWVHQAMPIQLRRIMGVYMGFEYYYPIPINVTFGSSITNPEEEREALLSPRNIGVAWAFPSFTDQTAFYNATMVQHTFTAIRLHLDKCLPQTEFVRKESTVQRMSARWDP